jgi:hypothetical protein
MIKKFSKIKSQIYDKCSLEVSDFNLESESKEYEASHFKLNGLNVIYRNAKITPKKVGQFVTFWKRKLNGPIEPFDEQDSIDFFVVSVQNEKKFGQFVFPKAVLIKKGILSTINKEGKRAFRVYPIWDVAKNKQAESTQKWQLDYFQICTKINSCVKKS